MDVDDPDEYSYSERDDDDALLAELARIKKEKNEERLQRKEKEAKLICGYPLVVSNAAFFTVKTRATVKFKHPSVSSTTRSGMTSIEKFVQKYMN
ncbi:hypothetical protein MKX01_013269 [Papaver californicum]|nr:hypothetical protein MKX01_013269 [Papaver californicum]